MILVFPLSVVDISLFVSFLFIFFLLSGFGGNEIKFIKNTISFMASSSFFSSLEYISIVAFKRF